ncbi:MAG: GNAT family N-acetyltransferase [Desulfobacterales bacterium]|nr:GNAT family N-acetyltransferase [Desulfobacterales bacterium]MDD4071559.1 GNAT family N-acetyltransferase [Desulfobacterales bacterium]MDD4391548.1 GNAT family N-acetyltransferase [Desulfobacterales bacterium]
MAKFYIEAYGSALSGKTVFIACREGVLRDHFNAIITDIKFLNRYGIRTTLFHNMSNRFANQKHFRHLASRLPDTTIIRVNSDTDFYDVVLDYPENASKLIFLERKYLIDHENQRINSLTTEATRNKINTYGDLIANINFKNVLERICLKIDEGSYDRVHILAAGKCVIKRELFTIEGSGTLIANNFTETFSQVSTDDEVNIVFGILDMYRIEGFLKPRSREYVSENRGNFFVTRIDDIIVGSVEKKIIDPETVELGALAISTKFRNQRVGVYTVAAFFSEMAAKGYRRFVSLTNNPKLETLYNTFGFVQQSLPRYQHRQEQSPGVKMFYKQI